MPRQHQSSGGTGGVGAPSRHDDRSGLLDIHALSSMIDAQRCGGASASSVAMPTFGAPWGLHEVQPAAPLARLTTPAARVVAAADHRPLYVMIAALSLAVASLGAFVLMRPAPTVVVERAAVAAVAEPEAASAGEAAAEAEPEREAAVAAASAGEPTPEAAPEPAPEVEAVRSRSPRVTRPSPIAKPGPTPTPKAAPKAEGVIPVECVIDPSKCDKGKPQPRNLGGDEGRDASSTKALPDAPSAIDIRDAMASVKPQAKACGSRHGGRAGEKVRVKLSVLGATGKVTAAQAEGEHAGTPLGRCVADALAKATLPKFAKPQAGVMYAVTL
jgi:outer membrane biosynthesis protein TonB